jgi:hypothetical protein
MASQKSPAGVWMAQAVAFSSMLNIQAVIITPDA